MIRNRLLFQGSMPTFWGLIFNALGNGLFLTFVTKWTTGEMLLQITILWSAIFWASTLVSPIENLIVYDKIEKNPISTLNQLLGLSCLAFGTTGVLLVVFAKFNIITIFFLLFLGIVTAFITKIKAECIVQGSVKTIANAYVADGGGKCIALSIGYFYNDKLSLEWMMFSYLVGSLLCCVAYLKRGFFHAKKKPQEKKQFRQIIGVGVIGAFSSLTMGALPFLTSVFTQSTELAPFISFFLLTRSLLLLHGIFSINNPQLLKRIGDLKSPSLSIRFIIASVPTLYLILLLTRNTLVAFDFLNLSPIKNIHVLFFAASLALGLIFSIYLSSQNASETWILGLIACLVSLISAVAILLLVSSDVHAFLLAAIAAPLAGILILSIARMKS